MFRTVLRAAKLLMSLFSTMLLLVAPLPTGGPSLLARIPILMDALEARLDAKAAGPVDMGAVPTTGELPPDVAFPPVEMALPPMDDPSAAVPPEGLPRLPTGTDRVRVNRGLP